MATKLVGEAVEVPSLSATTTIAAGSAVTAVTSVTGATVVASTADGLSQNGNKVADEFAVVTDLMAASVDKWVFVADRAYQVIGFKEVHSVVGGSGAVVRPRKVTAAGTAAPGDAAGATVKELTTADIDLTATVNVVQTPTVSATAADMLLAAGDKIGLNLGGTLTGLVGQLVIFLRPV
jgi:hypothetical protein